MRSRWIVLPVVLGIAIVLALGVGSKVRTQGRSPATSHGVRLRPGTYRTKWIIPKPDQQSVDNPKAGEVLLPRPRDVGRKAGPLPRIQGTLVMYDERNKIMFALDASSNRYDTLRLDTNRNGDLSDDKAIKGVVQKSELDPIGRFVFISVADLPLRKLIPSTDSNSTVALDFYVEQVTPAVCYVEVRRRGCWTGTADSDKGPIPFRILDRNMNGRYSDTWEMLGRTRRGGDTVVFDWSAKGDFHSPFGEYPKYRAASAPAEVFGELVELRPGDSGDQLTIAPYGGPAGRIVVHYGKIGSSKVDAEPYMRWSDLQGHSQQYTLPTDGTVMAVPTGEYYLHDVYVAPRGDKTPNWTLAYLPKRPIVVEEGKTSTVMVDGQLRMVTIPPENAITRKRGRAADIQVAMFLSDQGLVRIDEAKGSVERATGIMLPTVRMMNSRGNVVYKGGRIDWSDRYRGTFADYGIIPKTLRPGKYTYEISFDTGPFGGVLKARKTVVVK